VYYLLGNIKRLRKTDQCYKLIHAVAEQELSPLEKGENPGFHPSAAATAE